MVKEMGIPRDNLRNTELISRTNQNPNYATQTQNQVHIQERGSVLREHSKNKIVVQ